VRHRVEAAGVVGAQQAAAVRQRLCPRPTGSGDRPSCRLATTFPRPSWSWLAKPTSRCRCSPRS
jgi:hypothetical protein